MTDQRDLEYTYTLFDKIFRYSIGKMADFSGAMYNGDFSMSLEQAQRQKHAFIVKSLNIEEDSKVLDMGCGWGPFLKYIEERGARGIGVTLSTGQAEACIKNGLDVHLMDCRTISPATFGKFDAIVSSGAFEHHCSKKEWEGGKQNLLNKDFRKRLDLSGESPHRLCFEREIIDHMRFVFEKVA